MGIRKMTIKTTRIIELFLLVKFKELKSFITGFKLKLQETNRIFLLCLLLLFQKGFAVLLIASRFNFYNPHSQL